MESNEKTTWKLQDKYRWYNSFIIEFKRESEEKREKGIQLKKNNSRTIVRTKEIELLDWKSLWRAPPKMNENTYIYTKT